jgi:putative transposase
LGAPEAGQSTVIRVNTETEAVAETEETSVTHTGLGLRLDVSNVEANLLSRNSGARRYCYNKCVEQIKANYTIWAAERAGEVPKEDRTRPPSAIDLRTYWTSIKPIWAADHSWWLFDQACRDAAQANQNFLKGLARPAKFAKKGERPEHFTVLGRQCTLEAGRIRLPRIGWIKISSPDPAQAQLRRLIRRGRARLLSVSVTQRSDGHWHATLKIEKTRVTTTLPTAPTGPVVGIDRGIKTNAVVATRSGEVVATLPTVKRIKRGAKALARAQRTVAWRTKPGQEASKNAVKAKARVAKLHSRIRTQREASLHSFTKVIASSYPVIVVENLATKNLMANHNLAQAIAEQGWGVVARQLTYKAEKYGSKVVVVDRYFPSSKTCGWCGAVKTKLNLATRVYSCESCALVLDRDVNAPANLAAWGEHEVGLCTCSRGTQARTRDPHGRPGVAPEITSGRFMRHACGGWGVLAPPVKQESASSPER